MIYTLSITNDWNVPKDELIKLGFQYDEDGYIDTFNHDEPTIEFNTLEELNTFVEKWDRVVVGKWNDGTWYIEIYNGYRE